MSMEMSARDKKLLVYLVAVVILALAYFFGAKPLLEKKDEMDSEIATLQAEVDELTEIYNNQDTYAQRISEEQAKFKTAIEKFPGGLTQEYTLMMLQDIEDNTGTWLSRVAFTEEQLMTGSEESEYVEEGAAEEVTEEPAEVETEGEEGGEVDMASISVSDIRTIRQDLALDYSCSYSNFKKFIDYIENYDRRLFISNINARYSPESNEVSGTVTLSQFAVAGAGKKVDTPNLSGVSLGVDNIFTTLNGTTGEESADNVLQLGELSIEDGEGEEGEESEGEEEESDEEGDEGARE